ncbi:MAG: hypothetical protein ABL996_09220 [Micropepsaceae bacterium]
MIRLPFPQVADDRGWHHGAMGGALANGLMPLKERFHAKPRKEEKTRNDGV